VELDESGEVVVVVERGFERTCGDGSGLGITICRPQSDAGDDLGAEGVDYVVRVHPKDSLELGDVAGRDVEVLSFDVALKGSIGCTAANLFSTDAGVPEHVVSNVLVSEVLW